MRFSNPVPTLAVAVAVAVAITCLAAQLHAQGEPIFDIDNLGGTALPGASGAPKGLSPIAAAATCHTNGVGSTTIQWAANGFAGAGVPTDGTAAIYIAASGTSPTGRRFAKITGYTAGTVTVQNSWNISAASPADCAVGGALLTLEDRLIQDVRAGWRMEVEATGTDYTFGAAIPDMTAQTSTPAPGFAQVVGVNGRPVLDWTANTEGIGRTDYIMFRNLAIENSSGGSTTAFTTVFQDVQFNDVQFSGWAYINNGVGGGFAVVDSYLNGVSLTSDGTLYGLVLANYLYQPTGLCVGVSMRGYVVGNICHDVQTPTGCFRSRANNGQLHWYNTVDDDCGTGEGIGDALMVDGTFFGNIVAAANTGQQGGDRPDALQPIWGGNFFSDDVTTVYGTAAVERTDDVPGTFDIAFVARATDDWQPQADCANGLGFPPASVVFGAQTQAMGLPDTVNIATAGASQVEDPGQPCGSAAGNYLY